MLLETRIQTMDKLQRHTRTGLGVSKEYYCQKKGEPRIGGNVQGKTDVPTMFALLSDVLLRVHASIAPGLEMHSCNLEHKVQHHSIAFVDDVDGHVTANPDSEDCARDIVAHLNRAGAIWNNLFEIAGQSIALHKVRWRTLVWEMRDREWKLVTSAPGRVKLTDSRGAVANVDYVPPNEPNEGLGFLMCPDGNQEPQFERVMSILSEVTDRIARAYLMQDETHQAVYQRVEPKIAYPMALTSFGKDQCRRENGELRSKVLPKLKMSRKAPGAVVHGPMEMGGMEWLELYTKQNQLQVPYLMKQVRHGGPVAEWLHMVMANTQLRTGLMKPIFNSMGTKIECMGNYFMISLRNRMEEIGATFWLEKAWVPKLQLKRDESLMERFVATRGINVPMLQRANQVRLWLRVITIADLAHVSGKYIADNMMTGEWRAGSNLLWPNVAKPNQRVWKTFCKCVKMAFCTGV